MVFLRHLIWIIIISLMDLYCASINENSRCLSSDVDEKLCTTREEAARGAVATLHSQLDDDKNGAVDSSEADDFVRDELQYTENFERAKLFNLLDNNITKDELWTSWRNSIVFNWTVDDVADWLTVHVELPEYRRVFVSNVVDGSRLPLLASNNKEYLKNILKIKNPIHLQKIVLKAMDVVLFGPPKKVHSPLQDFTLVVSLFVAMIGLWFAITQYRYSQLYLKNMARDLDSLTRAEQSLVDLQKKLADAEHRSEQVQQEKTQIVSKLLQETEVNAARLVEVSKLTEADYERLLRAEEEVEYLRGLLEESSQAAAGGIYGVCIALQPWLQLTYEIELRYYTAKKNGAEMQLAQAREECEKIRKKRGTFMGSLRIAHSSSLDDVDKRITEAREALEEIRTDLNERLGRWRQIESIAQFQIMNNPGYHHLITMLKYCQSSSGASSSLPRSESSNSMQQQAITSSATSMNSYSRVLNGRLGSNSAVHGMNRSESFVRPYAALWRRKTLETVYQTQKKTNGNTRHFVVGSMHRSNFNSLKPCRDSSNDSLNFDE